MAKKIAKRAKIGKPLNEKIKDLIKLIEGLPRHHYAAPGAMEDLEARLTKAAGANEGEMAAIASAIMRARLEEAGDRHYNYGYGVLLRKPDLDRLIWCLKVALAALSGKRGNRPKDEDERREKVYQDYDLFERKLREGKLSYPDDWAATKKWVMEECKKEWHVDDRQANNRIKAILKYEPELFAYASLHW